MNISANTDLRIDLSPLEATRPCGPSLEYDAEYAILLARMAPRVDAQYGEFVGLADAPNWADIERDCRRLLMRTRDINVLVWLCRARTRLAQATGLAQSLAMLAQTLQAWPDAIHPQLVVEGERDPAVRANALAALADPDGLLGDVREIVVATNAVRHLTVRDVERAHAVPRLPEAPSPESVAQQLEGLQRSASGDVALSMKALATALKSAREIAAWSASHLGDDAPALHALLELLKPFEQPESRMTAVPPEVADAVGPFEPVEQPDILPVRSRSQVRDNIRAARDWFEAHEPSSPVAILLGQAERMVGRRFSEVADAIPLDLLRKWDAQGEPT
jgi:type VI secretion system protein ImpA